MLKWEPAADRGIWALSDPRFSNPSQDKKEVLLWSEELGPICSSLSPSPTYLSHTTNINLFENKEWEIYFYKEVCSFVHWSSSLLLTMFQLIFVYVYVCGYTTKSLNRRVGQLRGNRCLNWLIVRWPWRSFKYGIVFWDDYSRFGTASFPYVFAYYKKVSIFIFFF